MNDTSSRPLGIVDSLRALADGLLASVQDRVALFGVELEQEKLRLVQGFAWIAALIVTGIVALVSASATLVCLFWDTARAAVLIGLTVFHAALFGGVLIGCSRAWARQPRPLAGTLGEIAEDRRCIRSDS
jgi:uncharacterized membrane protein YqjE